MLQHECTLDEAFGVVLIVSCHFRCIVSHDVWSLCFEARVIQVYNGSSDLLPLVLEETGGLGVDIVIDSGGKNNDSLTFMNTCAIL